MGKYRDHRDPRRRRNEDDANFISERTPEPTYFQRAREAGAQPVNAEVLWLNESKGFGFVKLEDGAEAYLHARVLEAAGARDLSEGTRLKVVVEENQRGRQVSQVLEIGETVGKASSHAQATEIGSRGLEASGETRGIVKWYNPDKGFGFIAPRDGEKDVFVHASVLSRYGLTTLAEGQQVLMECGQGKKGLEVRSIRLA